MSVLTKKVERRLKIKKGIRSRVFGTPEKPRLSVFRSNKAIYAQLIDDNLQKTIVGVHSKKDTLKADAGERKGKIATAYLLGLAMAQKAQQEKVSTVVFDRGSFLYHGRVEAFAQGVRDGGIKF